MWKIVSIFLSGTTIKYRQQQQWPRSQNTMGWLSILVLAVTLTDLSSISSSTLSLWWFLWWFLFVFFLGNCRWQHQMLMQPCKFTCLSSTFHIIASYQNIWHHCIKMVSMLKMNYCFFIDILILRKNSSTKILTLWKNSWLNILNFPPLICYFILNKSVSFHIYLSQIYFAKHKQKFRSYWTKRQSNSKILFTFHKLAIYFKRKNLPHC